VTTTRRGPLHGRKPLHDSSASSQQQLLQSQRFASGPTGIRLNHLPALPRLRGRAGKGAILRHGDHASIPKGARPLLAGVFHRNPPSPSPLRGGSCPWGQDTPVVGSHKPATRTDTYSSMADSRQQTMNFATSCDDFQTPGCPPPRHSLRGKARDLLPAMLRGVAGGPFQYEEARLDPKNAIFIAPPAAVRTPHQGSASATVLRAELLHHRKQPPDAMRSGVVRSYHPQAGDDEIGRDEPPFGGCGRFSAASR
jgi:hypothetical protein